MDCAAEVRRVAAVLVFESAFQHVDLFAAGMPVRDEFDACRPPHQRNELAAETVERQNTDALHRPGKPLGRATIDDDSLPVLGVELP